MPKCDTYPDKQFIESIESLERASAGEIAELVGCNARVATLRLKRLVANDKVKSKLVSGRWQFWL